MLQSIRERAQGWLAWVIVILISIPFALWGIQEYLGVGAETVKASVNDREISEREFDSSYRQFREQLRQRMGKEYRPELVDDKLLRKEVLDSIINSELIHQQAIQLGMLTSDEVLRALIKNSPTFQVNGKFSQAAYENGARRQGLTTEGYEQQMRRLLLSDQLIRAVSGSEIVTKTELEESLRLAGQRRKLDYLVVPVSNFLPAVELKPEEAESYYNSNKQAFMSPERVKLEYLELDIKNIAKTVKVKEDDLLGFYEQQKSNYVLPEGRRASHILILAEDQADKAALAEARAAAEAALARVKSGEEFAKVAKELSQDPGSADNGGDLGFFEKGIMDPAFEKVAFELEKGAISDLVQTQFGFHIIQLADIRPEAGKSFEQARPDVLEAYRKDEAGRLFYEYAERLGDLAYEDPGSLEPASDALGLKIQTSDWMGRDGGEGVLAANRVVTTAFSEDVLTQRHNSELLELGAEHVMVLRVAEYEESRPQALDSVRGEVESLLKRRAASKLAQEKGRQLISAMSDGAALEQLAEEYGAKLQQPGIIGRTAKDVPGEVLDTLFTMPAPEGEKPVYGETALSNGDYAVLALYQVTDGAIENLGESDRNSLKRSMERMLGQTNFKHMIGNVRDGSEIVIPELTKE
jgi:peptidyl-prolyl cis-trans isomerase D